MIKSIAYEVTFPPSEIFPEGRSFRNVVTFGEGMTAITGHNEAGKSMVLEFIRFSLHGSKALRGVADDYKSLKVSTTFTVKGETWNVVRRGTTDAKLFRDGEDEPIVKGTKAVNLKIAELFGYGLDVFDASNAILQGEVEKLGSMLPADRKRLVDSTIGLNIIDGLIDWVGLQASNARLEADALGGVAVEPVEPTRPDGYRLSGEVAVERDRVHGLVRERDLAQAFLGRPVAEPIAPSCGVPHSAADLKTLVDLRRTKEQELANLKAKHATIPDAKYTADELDQFVLDQQAYDLYQERVKFEKAYKQPTVTKEEIAKERAAHLLEARYREGQHLRKRIADLKARGQHECPECKHTWDMEQDTIARLEEELASYPTESLGVMFSTAELDQLERQWISWDAMAPTWERLKGAAPCEPSPVSMDVVRREYDAIARAEEKAKLAEQIAAFVMPDDVSGLWQERVKYDVALAAYEKEKVAYDAWKTEADAKRARLAEILVEDLDAKLNDLNLLCGAAVAYEVAMQTYIVARHHYDETKAQIEAKRFEAEQFKLAVGALRELKLKVKQFLIPSLNKVSSYLLAQMTGGVRRRIEVDEEFNIRVDGQRLDTLSGSGKACANLAVRIGLGQVLTAKVFPVLMADEIDAAMDADRAGYTAECLRGLQKCLGQIILISHKRPDADHYIELGVAA